MLKIFATIIILLGGLLFVIMISKRPKGWLHPFLAIGLLIPQNIKKITDERSLEEKRQDAINLSLVYHGKLPDIHTEDITLVLKDREYNARIYYPKNASSKSILYFHGGGFMLGNIKASENICRWLCKYADVEVLSFEYPLAPENAFPLPTEISYQAYLWYYQQRKKKFESPEIFLCGDSAGGNISTVVSLMACHKEAPLPKGQCLIYPVVDLYHINNQAYQDFGTGYQLSIWDIIFFRKQYLPHESDWNHIYVSPLNHPVPLNMPPALIITAQFDVLSQEGREYAEKLQTAGVAVEYKMYKGMFHAFAGLTSIMPAAHKALIQVARFVKTK